MIVGFTGTREGMTGVQKQAFAQQLQKRIRKITQFHHGDCVGADREAHLLAVSGGLVLHVHPPENARFRAFCRAHVLYDPKPYMVRNRMIVNACDLLMATPRSLDPYGHSGTWATVQHAVRVGKPVLIIYPNGIQKIIEPGDAPRLGQ